MPKTRKQRSRRPKNQRPSTPWQGFHRCKRFLCSQHRRSHTPRSGSQAASRSRNAGIHHRHSSWDWSLRS
uniref:p8 n=1 Tax=Simian T-lymphotropic virus 3 TaxID=39101 RepID=A0A0A7RPX6_9DELA|nr:p8 [Simian T-lymphotropic virus 3]